MRLRERALDTGQIVLKIESIDEGIGVKISLQPKSKHCIKAALFMVRRFITAPFSNLSFGLDESPLSVKEGTKKKTKMQMSTLSHDIIKRRKPMKGVLAMPLSMTLEPVQKQQLTQHLIQQMNLLQMTSEELDAFVAREVEQNPLLDFPEERETWREEGPEWRRMHLRARDPSDDPPSSPVENAHALEMTLEAFLDDQIGCLSLSPLEARLAYFIAGTLDPSGYWREDPVAVAERFDATEEVVLAVLQQVQHLEPCGVAARSLKECLLMQLAQQKGDTSLAQKIIEEGLDDLARNRIPQLASRFNVTKEAILAARDLIRSLNPKPGTAFSEAGPVEFLHEDAFVKTTEKGLKITLSTSYGRTLVINKGYLSILDNSNRPKVKEYLKKELKKGQKSFKPS